MSYKMGSYGTIIKVVYDQILSRCGSIQVEAEITLVIEIEGCGKCKAQRADHYPVERIGRVAPPTYTGR